MDLFRIGLLLLLFLANFGECKLPLLTPEITKEKLDEALKGHATYKKLNTELIERVFALFIEELDPTKTYFVDNEIDKWIYPNDDLLNRTLREVKDSNYASFHEIHSIFLKAIDRRKEIESHEIEV